MQVTNSAGYSDISELNLQIDFPVFYGNTGRYLLYVVEQPIVQQGYGKCSFSLVNPENITVSIPLQWKYP